MNRIIARLSSTAGVALAVIAIMATPSSAASQVVVSGADLSSAPQVTLTVAVPLPSDGTSLPTSAFTVLESGQKRSTKVIGLPGDASQITLVIDTSGSMAGAGLAGAQSAAKALLAQLPPAASVSVIGFGNSPYVASQFTLDRAATRTAIDGLKAAGETALNDAVILSSSSFSTPKRTMVLLTDGRDTVSNATTPEATTAAKNSGAIIYGVVLDTTDSDVTAPTAFASASGGKVARAADPSGLKGIFSRIGSELASQYRLSFVATGKGSTGITVKIKSKELNGSGVIRLSLPASPTSAGADLALPSPSLPRGTESAPTGPLGSTTGLVIGVCAILAGIAIGAYALITRERPPSQLAGGGDGNLGRGETTLLEQIKSGASAFADSSLKTAQRSEALNSALERAGIDLRPGEYILAAGGAILGAAFIGAILDGVLMALIFGFIAFMVIRLMLKRSINRRQIAFADQLEQTLPLLAGSLRAGFSVTQAIDSVARESDSPTADEFRRVVTETRLGRDLDVALAALAGRIQNPDFQWVVQAIEIHRAIGGDLAEILDNVFATIHDRNSVRRQISALGAEGRLSGIILIALPFGAGIFIQLVNPGYMGLLTQSALGWTLIFGALGSMAIGAFWMNRLLKVEY